MFNIGFSELLLVLLVAFLVVGPKDLPKVARWLGRAVKKSRRNPAGTSWRRKFAMFSTT